MQSDALTVSAYLEEVPEERLAALNRMRQLCQTSLEGFEESMEYGMPCYSRDGVVEVAFASQKNYIALYIMRSDVLDAHRASFAASAMGKGCIRYRNPARIDFGLVETMLLQAVTSEGPLC